MHEFTASEGRVYVPDWMISALGTSGGAIAHISTCTLNVGRFVKLQPQSVDFLDITNPRAV